MKLIIALLIPFSIASASIDDLMLKAAELEERVPLACYFNLSDMTLISNGFQLEDLQIETIKQGGSIIVHGRGAYQSPTVLKITRYYVRDGDRVTVPTTCNQGK